MSKIQKMLAVERRRGDDRRLRRERVVGHRRPTQGREARPHGHRRHRFGHHPARRGRVLDRVQQDQARRTRCTASTRSAARPSPRRPAAPPIARPNGSSAGIAELEAGHAPVGRHGRPLRRLRAVVAWPHRRHRPVEHPVHPVRDRRSDLECGQPHRSHQRGHEPEHPAADRDLQLRRQPAQLEACRAP